MGRDRSECRVLAIDMPWVLSQVNSIRAAANTANTTTSSISTDDSNPPAHSPRLPHLPTRSRTPWLAVPNSPAEKATLRHARTVSSPWKLQQRIAVHRPTWCSASSLQSLLLRTGTTQSLSPSGSALRASLKKPCAHQVHARLCCERLPPRL